MRIVLGVEYDGTGFCGWQSQAGGGSVQDALESALAVVADAPVRVVCAGRTDAGVHALQQVVHFDTAVERPLSAWVRGVNANLPDSVAVLSSSVVAEDFHARFSALGRRYRYLLLNRPQRPGLMAQRVGWFHQPLDLATMQLAAACLIGEHDFSSFRAAECQAKSPVKTLHRLDVSRHGDLLVFDVGANAFLHHMVRNIVGALVFVGKGKHPPEWLAGVLAQRSRQEAPPTFAADGLYFAGVDYDPVWQLNLPTGPGAAFTALTGL